MRRVAECVRMPRPPEPLPSSTSSAGVQQVRRLVYQLRTEGGSRARESLAIALGVFVGCSPWYGFHLAICWALGRLLGLNRLKMYLAANVSNPVAAPFLVFAELQAGAWLRRGSFHALSLDTVRTTDPWTFGADLVVGSLVVGAGLGALAGLGTWLGRRGRDGDPVFAALVSAASDRYVGTSITAWEFARGKLRGDPLYRAVALDGLLPPGGVLIDVGCGQGLMLALLAEAARTARSGNWPAPFPPPVFDRLIGIDSRERVAAIARRALGADADVIAGDARVHLPDACRVVLFFDVLHMMPYRDQEQLLDRMSRSLEPGGVILVREADAGAGWKFRAVQAGNTLKALAFGDWGRRFHFRTEEAWRQAFASAGFAVAVRGASQGTPFGNALFVLTRPRHESA